MFTHLFIHLSSAYNVLVTVIYKENINKDAQELEWGFLTLAPQIPKNE